MKPWKSFWWELGDTEGVILVDGRTAMWAWMPIRKTQWPDPKLVKMWARDYVLLFLVAYFRSSCWFKCLEPNFLCSSVPFSPD